MQERYEETVAIPEGAEGELVAEVAAMELAENREMIEGKQGKEEEEKQSCCWKERNHPHHGHHGHRGHHPLHRHLHHHGHHGHHHHGHHYHHKEKKWEKIEKKRMKKCGGKNKGSEGGWNSKFVGKLKHKLEKIDWKIESLQEKKLFILSRIQEIEEEEKRNNEGVQAPIDATPLPTDAA